MYDPKKAWRELLSKHDGQFGVIIWETYRCPSPGTNEVGAPVSRNFRGILDLFLIDANFADASKDAMAAPASRRCRFSIDEDERLVQPYPHEQGEVAPCLVPNCLTWFSVFSVGDFFDPSFSPSERRRIRETVHIGNESVLRFCCKYTVETAIDSPNFAKYLLGLWQAAGKPMEAFPARFIDSSARLPAPAP